MNDCSLSRGSIQSVMYRVVEDAENDDPAHDAGHVDGLDEGRVAAESSHGLDGDVGSPALGQVLYGFSRMVVVGIEYNVSPQLPSQVGLLGVPCGRDDSSGAQGSRGRDRGQAYVARSEHDDSITCLERAATHSPDGHGQRLD